MESPALPDVATGVAHAANFQVIRLILRRQHTLVAASLLVLIVVGWAYLTMAPMPMPDGAGVWSPAYLATSLAMWFIMMVAMMTPAIAPVALLYDRVLYRDEPGWHPRTLAFLLGYFAVWASFAAAATFVQAGLIETGLIDAMGGAGTRRFAAALFIGVALYQWSGPKEACLNHCHNPLGFIVQRRHGPCRDTRAGMAHGAWCVGCCWALMLLLFVGGVMNLAWVAVLTIVVAIEKYAPWPRVARTAIGLCALLAAGWLLISR